LVTYSEHVKYSSSCFNTPSFRCVIIVVVSSSLFEKDDIRASRSSERFLRSCSMCRSRFSRLSNSVVVIRRDRRTPEPEPEPDAFRSIEVSASHLWSSSFKRVVSSGTFRFLVRGADEGSGWDATKVLLAATLTKERMSRSHYLRQWPYKNVNDAYLPCFLDA